MRPERGAAITAQAWINRNVGSVQSRPISNFLKMDFIYSIDWYLILTSLAKSVGVLGIVLFMVSYTVYAERRVSALIQDRLGPNRVGFPITLLGAKNDFSPILGGLGQPVADAMKLLLKEDFTPAHVNKLYYWIAPALGLGNGREREGGRFQQACNRLATCLQLPCN